MLRDHLLRLYCQELDKVYTSIGKDSYIVWRIRCFRVRVLAKIVKKLYC